MNKAVVGIHAQLRAILSAAGSSDVEAESAAIAGAAPSAEQALVMAKRRATGEPLAYIIGRQRFMGLELLTDAGVLAPREETELLGETALRILRMCGAGAAPRVIDMCCGSGNLACAIASRLPEAQVWACDLTDGCADLTRRNVSFLGLKDRVIVAQGDLFAPLQNLCPKGSVNVVVCNPPYISTRRLERDRASLLTHEPREAFDAGPYGLAIHMRLVTEALPYLAPGGWLLCEFGHGQERQVELLFRRTGDYDEIHTISDPAGAPRVALGRKKETL